MEMINNDKSLQHLLDELSEDDDAKQILKTQTKEIQQLYTYYRCAMYEIETKFHVLSEEFSLLEDSNPIESIKIREKSMRSLLNKLHRRNLPFSATAIFDNIFDVAGVRVICAFEDDVYSVAQSLLKQDDIELLEEKDYIKNPKANGYRSLHLIVTVPIFLAKEKKKIPVEIQIRTIAMDFWAALEHQIRYKKDNDKAEELAIPLKACAELSATLDHHMNSLRQKLNENEK